MKRMILLAALLLVACGSKAAATPAVSSTSSAATTASPTTSATPAAVTAHFVATAQSSAKVDAAQTDPWIDVIAFHEVGLNPGQAISYHVTGAASASYTCSGKAATAAGPVGTTRSFTADANGEVSDVIAVQPPVPTGCTSGYPQGIWGFKYETLRVLDVTDQVSEDVPGMSGGA